LKYNCILITLNFEGQWAGVKHATGSLAQPKNHGR